VGCLEREIICVIDKCTYRSIRYLFRYSMETVIRPFVMLPNY
jgi:hypothetical protein